jgi:hypothetical protein
VKGKWRSGQNGRRASPIRRELADMMVELRMAARVAKKIEAARRRSRSGTRDAAND